MADISTGLLVIGGGAAGFAAALTAAEAGTEVLLIEKLDEIGGSSAMSGGCLAFAGTDLQREAGIEDSPELLARDLIEVGGDADEALVRVYADEQLDTYGWLRQHGVAFSPALEASSGQSVPRVHTVDPADMVRLLAARCRETGRVKVMMSTRALRLQRPTEGARVEAVRIESREGVATVRPRAGVVLASGGFGRNAELVHRYAPQYDHAVFVCGAGNVGDGLRMAAQLGADTRDMIHIKGTYGKHPVDTHNHHSCLAVYKGAIAVNEDGHRFVDESISYKLLGDAVMAQPLHTSWQILDQPIFDSGENQVRILDFQRRLDEGLMVRAESLEALSRMIEIPVERLRETLDRYNAFVDAGHDADYGRQHLVHRHGALRRIETAPFYAYPSTASVFGTYCGLRIDPRMRVIDVFDEPIAGLYAAGEVVGGFHGSAYMTGSALGKALVFGRRAARSAMGGV